MPIIEYRCKACGRVFEDLRPRADDPAPHCPQCGGSGSERLLSVFAVTQPRPASSPGPCGSPDCACRRS